MGEELLAHGRVPQLPEHSVRDVVVEAQEGGDGRPETKQALVGRMADVPEYDVLGDGSSSQAPVVNAAGLRRRLLSTAAEVQSRI